MKMIVILDPFGQVGGSTLLACKETNRNYIGFELDKHYYDIAEQTNNILTHEQLKVGD